MSPLRSALCAAALLALGAACRPALGAEAPAVAPANDPAPDSARIAIAAQILEDTHASVSMNMMLDAMTPEVLADLKQNHPNIPDGTLQQFSTLFREDLNSQLPQLMRLEASVYARHFSLAELQAIQHFYASDVGRKIMAEVPQILSEIRPVGMAWGQQAGRLAVAHTVEKLKAKGVDIAAAPASGERH